MRMIFMSRGDGALRCKGDPARRGVPAHPRERSQASGVAKHRPAMSSRTGPR